jgi:hypothetical protein
MCHDRSGKSFFARGSPYDDLFPHYSFILGAFFVDGCLMVVILAVRRITLDFADFGYPYSNQL